MLKIKFLQIFFLLFSIAICDMQYAICDIYAQDKIIAIVNNDIITQKDLDDFINFMRMQLQQDYKGKELENKIQSIKLDLLDRLVEDLLILQQAKKNNLKIDENLIKARVSEIKKRYGSDADFQRALTQQGLTQSDIESKIRDQLLMYNIIDQNIRSKIEVTPSEVTEFYEKNSEEFKTTQERQVTSIAVESEDLANTVFNDLKDGKDLGDIANRYSVTVDKMTVRQEGSLRKDIEDIICKLNTNEVCQPIKVNDRFYIFRLDNIVAARQKNLSEAQVNIYAFLFDKKLQEGLAKWLDELKAHSYIKILQD